MNRDDPHRPVRSPPPSSAPFIVGAADRPERPVPPRFGDSDTKPSFLSNGQSSTSDIAVPTLPKAPGVRFGPSPIGGNASSSSSYKDSPSLPAPPSFHRSGYINHYATAGTSSSTERGTGQADFRRKKSLVRPDRAPIDPSHRLFNYRNHAAAMEADERGRTGLSSTGMAAVDGSVAAPLAYVPMEDDARYQDYVDGPRSPLHPGSPGAMQAAGLRHNALSALGRPVPGGAGAGYSTAGGPGQVFGPNGERTNLRRGRSLLARGPGEADESGLSILKRGETLRRQRSNKSRDKRMKKSQLDADEISKSVKAKKPVSPWMIYCNIITCCCPNFLLSCFGIKSPERARAWREKIGMLGIIAVLMGGVGFLTFGFTQAVCGKPPLRYKAGSVEGGMMIFHGKAYDMDKFQHVGAPGISAGTNPLYTIFNTGGKDGSFLFQNVNQHCKGIITAASGTGIPVSGDDLGWYFPCNIYNQFGTSLVNKTGYAEGAWCHTQSDARQQFADMKPLGDVYYTWNNMTNTSRNLAVYEDNVLDLSLLNWLDKSQVDYPAFFDELKVAGNQYSGQDITMQVVRSGGQELGDCLTDVIKVGVIDTNSLGCVAADVVLYVSLVVIIGVVVIKWGMAVSFAWFFGWRLGAFGKETSEQRKRRLNEIENWTSDIYRPAPARYRPNAKNGKRSILPSASRFTPVGGKTTSVIMPPGPGLRPTSTFVGGGGGSGSSTPPTGQKSFLGAGMRNSPPGSPGIRASRTSTTLPQATGGKDSRRSSMSGDGLMNSCPFPLYNVVPQPPADYMPFNFPLVHTICLVTAYSESVEGLRTTLDSLATTDYPNSHKLILVIADGMVKGAGNDLTTPEICLSMMKELVVPAEDCEALSYVAIADGHKMHNMAKVYAGFYSYDDNTVESSKQQRVPVVLVAKVGNPMEAHEAKPGNRGKRDSQVLLMSFLQKVMFDERMSAFEYEFFNSIWRCTGVSPDKYEVCLTVDADTKVFPDSVTRMTACMVQDTEIMGLCGETKIANKSETWVTMIQVFEYYISHHQQKAFESMFGGVTCLPGCFSMYRIKAPKGPDGYWVPILANPDIVEHYSENIVDSLHAKNLLLLGEDRFLTTLMLKTFPKRKMMFCPSAVCKTIVPDTFRVLLSQRRRWINSTIHNLFELIFVRDLCGTFCFSMQFVLGMELAGTLVLPAAIAFTIYIIVLTIIPHTTKPIISLILLGFILGLPGLLIVVTSRRIAYVGWMLIYLISLPIWNFILPTYAYLHMDDFTWGATRQVAGGKEKAHGDKEGEFDSSNIVMKRWAEFERDRRWKSGTHSRDSTYEAVNRNASPHRPGSHRLSVNSSVDTWSNAPTDPFSNRHGFGADGDALSTAAYHGTARTRGESIQELSLPQPLARETTPPTGLPSSITSPEAAASQDTFSTRHEAAYGPIHSSQEGWIEETRILTDSPSSPQMASPPFSQFRDHSPANNSTTALPEFAHYYSNKDGFLSTEPESVETVDTRRSESRPRASASLRGVSLIDDGVVPDAKGGYRQVDRPRRQSTTTASSGNLAGARQSRASLQNIRSHTVDASNSPHLPQPPQPPMSPHSSSGPSRLPPGAAPPQSPDRHGR